MSDPPAGPRGTLPLGLGPFPSPAAPRAEREARATVRPPTRGPRQEPELPELLELSEASYWDRSLGPEPTVEPHRSAQRSGGVARALRAPALRAPVRLRGRWRAPSLARLALARLTRRPAVRGVLAVLAVLAPAALAVTLAGRPAAPSPSCADDHAPELRPAVEYMPAGQLGAELPELRQEPELPAARGVTSARAAPVARAPRAPASGAALPKPSSDVRDPWRIRGGTD